MLPPIALYCAEKNNDCFGNLSFLYDHLITNIRFKWNSNILYFSYTHKFKRDFVKVDMLLLQLILELEFV